MIRSENKSITKEEQTVLDDLAYIFDIAPKDKFVQQFADQHFVLDCDDSRSETDRAFARHLLGVLYRFGDKLPYFTGPSTLHTSLVRLISCNHLFSVNGELEVTPDAPVSSVLRARCAGNLGFNAWAKSLLGSASSSTGDCETLKLFQQPKSLKQAATDSYTFRSKEALDFYLTPRVRNIALVLAARECNRVDEVPHFVRRLLVSLPASSHGPILPQPLHPLVILTDAPQAHLHESPALALAEFGISATLAELVSIAISNLAKRHSTITNLIKRFKESSDPCLVPLVLSIVCGHLLKRRECQNSYMDGSLDTLMQLLLTDTKSVSKISSGSLMLLAEEARRWLAKNGSGWPTASSLLGLLGFLDVALSTHERSFKYADLLHTYEQVGLRHQFEHPTASGPESLMNSSAMWTTSTHPLRYEPVPVPSLDAARDWLRGHRHFSAVPLLEAYYTELEGQAIPITMVVIPRATRATVLRQLAALLHMPVDNDLSVKHPYFCASALSRSRDRPGPDARADWIGCKLGGSVRPYFVAEAWRPEVAAHETLLVMARVHYTAFQRASKLVAVTGQMAHIEAALGDECLQANSLPVAHIVYGMLLAPSVYENLAGLSVVTHWIHQFHTASRVDESRKSASLDFDNGYFGSFLVEPRMTSSDGKKQLSRLPDFTNDAFGLYELLYSLHAPPVPGEHKLSLADQETHVRELTKKLLHEDRRVMGGQASAFWEECSRLKKNVPHLQRSDPRPLANFDLKVDNPYNDLSAQAYVSYCSIQALPVQMARESLQRCRSVARPTASLPPAAVEPSVTLALFDTSQPVLDGLRARPPAGCSAADKSCRSLMPTHDPLLHLLRQLEINASADLTTTQTEPVHALKEQFEEAETEINPLQATRPINIIKRQFRADRLLSRFHRCTSTVNPPLALVKGEGKTWAVMLDAPGELWMQQVSATSESLMSPRADALVRLFTQSSILRERHDELAEWLAAACRHLGLTAVKAVDAKQAMEDEEEEQDIKAPPYEPDTGVNVAVPTPTSPVYSYGSPSYAPSSSPSKPLPPSPLKPKEKIFTPGERQAFEDLGNALRKSNKQSDFARLASLRQRKSAHEELMNLKGQATGDEFKEEMAQLQRLLDKKGAYSSKENDEIRALEQKWGVAHDENSMLDIDKEEDDGHGYGTAGDLMDTTDDSGDTEMKPVLDAFKAGINEQFPLRSPESLPSSSSSESQSDTASAPTKKNPRMEGKRATWPKPAAAGYTPSDPSKPSESIVLSTLSNGQKITAPSFTSLDSAMAGISADPTLSSSSSSSSSKPPSLPLPSAMGHYSKQNDFYTFESSRETSLDTLTEGDFARLDQPTSREAEFDARSLWLNDKIVNSYLHLLVLNLPEHVRSDIRILQSYFFTKLQEAKTNSASSGVSLLDALAGTGSKCDHRGFLIHLYSIVPVNDPVTGHWFFIIVSHASASSGHRSRCLICVDTRSCGKPVSPFASAAARLIGEFVQCVAKRYNNDIEMPELKTKARSVTPQKDGYNCGPLMLHLIDLFTQDPAGFIKSTTPINTISGNEAREQVRQKLRALRGQDPVSLPTPGPAAAVPTSASGAAAVVPMTSAESAEWDRRERERKADEAAAASEREKAEKAAMKKRGEEAAAAAQARKQKAAREDLRSWRSGAASESLARRTPDQQQAIRAKQAQEQKEKEDAKALKKSKSKKTKEKTELSPDTSKETSEPSSSESKSTSKKTSGTKRSRSSRSRSRHQSRSPPPPAKKARKSRDSDKKAQEKSRDNRGWGGSDKGAAPPNFFHPRDIRYKPAADKYYRKQTRVTREETVVYTSVSPAIKSVVASKSPEHEPEPERERKTKPMEDVDQTATEEGEVEEEGTVETHEPLPAAAATSMDTSEDTATVTSADICSCGDLVAVCKGAGIYCGEYGIEKD